MSRQHRSGSTTTALERQLDDPLEDATGLAFALLLVALTILSAAIGAS